MSLFVLVLVILQLFSLVIAEETCPYPCFPPPFGTGGGVNTYPTIGGPPSPPPPPQAVQNYLPPGNYPTAPILPVHPPPQYYYGFGLPPPDPIMPYFPYYYKKPVQGNDGSPLATSSAIGAFLGIVSSSLYLLVL